MLSSDVEINGKKMVVIENSTDLNEKLGTYMTEILKKTINERSIAKIALSGEKLLSL